jgi:hypothetical protein
MKGKVLAIALRKLTDRLDLGWHGYLSYAEIVALYQDGYRETGGRDTWYHYAVQHLKAGISGQTWVYYERLGAHKPDAPRHREHTHS